MKKYLLSLNKKQLVDLVAILFKQIPQVNYYFRLQLDEKASNKIVDKYKKSIKNEFFPTRGFGKARLSIARKAVDTFKQVAPRSLLLIDLMFYYVEQGVKYTLEYGDICESFYISMETMFERALELAKKIEGLKNFQERSSEIVFKTCGIGWGFHDRLSEIRFYFYKEKCRKCGY